MKKQIRILSLAFLSIGLLFTSCKKKETEPTIEVEDFTATIAENPQEGDFIGTVDATIHDATNIRYSFIPENSEMSQNVNIDPSGNLSVSNPEYFDFEQRYQIVGSAEVIASDDNSNETRASFQITIDITDVYEAPDPSSMSVQQRLDGTETPFDIYTSDNSLLDSLYGKTYNGGLIFYLNTTTGNGMVAYTSSFSPLAWDFNTTGLVATNANSTDVGQGETNTTSIVIVLGTGGNYPARTCRELA